MGKLISSNTKTTNSPANFLESNMAVIRGQLVMKLTWCCLFLVLQVSMLSFVNSKPSLTTVAEWSPSDWPESLSELRVFWNVSGIILRKDFFEAILETILFIFRFQTIDNLLRCSICYEYFDVAMIVPDCSHNCEFKFEMFFRFCGCLGAQGA